MLMLNSFETQNGYYDRRDLGHPSLQQQVHYAAFGPQLAKMRAVALAAKGFSEDAHSGA